MCVYIYIETYRERESSREVISNGQKLPGSSQSFCFGFFLPSIQVTVSQLPCLERGPDPQMKARSQSRNLDAMSASS